MKGKIIFLLFFFFGSCLNLKSQQVPDTLSNQWISLFEYCIDRDGLYQKVENRKTHRIIKKMSVLLLDKKTNEMYAFDDYGCYHVTLQANWTAYVKNQYKAGKLKLEELKDELIRIEKQLDSKFNTLNENILAKKAKKEEERKKESERIEKQLKEKRESQLAEYRQFHQNWRSIPFKSLNCECLMCEQKYGGNVIRLSGDTLFAIERKQGYLGYTYSHVHAFLLGYTDKYNMRNYLEAYHDSLTYGIFNMPAAQYINNKCLTEYVETIRQKAPVGFIHKWGWHLNSAEGIEPYFAFFNSSKKTIKYVDLYFNIYNAVGDKCYLKYNKTYLGNIRGVGPVESFELGSWSWDRATHYTSADASEMRIVKLVITYMDGTTKTILQNSIMYDE